VIKIGTVLRTGPPKMTRRKGKRVANFRFHPVLGRPTFPNRVKNPKPTASWGLAARYSSSRRPTRVSSSLWRWPRAPPLPRPLRQPSPPFPTAAHTFGLLHRRALPLRWGAVPHGLATRSGSRPSSPAQGEESSPTLDGDSSSAANHLGGESTGQLVSEPPGFGSKEVLFKCSWVT
jgi:hypothetical protein